MKTLLFLSALLFSALFGSAQYTQPENTPGSGGSYFTQKSDYTGKPIPSGEKLDVEGTEFLNDHWAVGTVLFRRGRISPFLELELSLTNNKLYFRRNDTVFSFSDSINEFTMNFFQDSVTEKLLFKRGYPPIDGQTESAFYKVDEAGKNVELIRFIEKRLEMRLGYNSPSKSYYMTIETWYVFDVKRKTMKRINNKKNSMLAALPEYANSINQYRNKENKNSLTFEDVVSIVQSLND